MPNARKHAFQAIQLEADGSESILDTFTVTKQRSADAAYVAAEALCEQARQLTHKPAAFVREVSGFAKGFGCYVGHGDSIDCEIDGVTYTARLVFDQDTQPTDFEGYEEAIDAWKADEWRFYGVVIDAEVLGWETLHVNSLWGCEGNYPGTDNSRLTEVANELLPEAIEIVKAKLAEVAALRALMTEEA